MDNKVKHLEFLQAIITRMGHNAFLLKGWAVTLVAALFALSADGAQYAFTLVAYLPVVVFWGLDAYYLSLERSYRSLYEEVRQRADNAIDFSMDTTSQKKDARNQWGSCLWGVTTAGFYGVLVVAMIVVACLLQAAR